jgi:hypothetical protein
VGSRPLERHKYEEDNRMAVDDAYPTMRTQHDAQKASSVTHKKGQFDTQKGQQDGKVLNNKRTRKPQTSVYRNARHQDNFRENSFRPTSVGVEGERTRMRSGKTVEQRVQLIALLLLNLVSVEITQSVYRFLSQ